jgi:hypothetical protein
MKFLAETAVMAHMCQMVQPHQGASAPENANLLLYSKHFIIDWAQCQGQLQFFFINLLQPFARLS